MGEQMIILEAILPNPWQPRESEDAEHIKALALDIAAHGLLQKPVGRVVDNGQSVQLAFGHSRLAAYKWLNDVQNNSNIEGDWSSMPVIIQDLTDEQMCEMAISENLQRRDLTPIEVAKAMARYRSEFGKTSVEIGQLFGLSDSAVRNKMRLVELPKDIQKGLVENGISERAARELLALFDLPEDLRQFAEEHCYTSNKPSNIVRRVLKGASSEETFNTIQDMMKSIGARMSESLFKHTQVFEGDYRSPTCKNCPVRTTIQDEVWCIDRSCFYQKQNASKLANLEQASLVCDIPVGDTALENNWNANRFRGEDLRRIQEIKCENLRLVWADYERGSIKGYPHAEVICQKNNGHCTCKRALESGILKTPAPAVSNVEKPAPPAAKTLIEVFTGEPPENFTDEQPLPVIEPAQPKPLTADDLKEIDRQIRREKRRQLEECKAIREEAAQKIYAALVAHNSVLWAKVAAKIVNYSSRNSLDSLPFSELMVLIAEKIAVDMYDWQYISQPNSQMALARFNDWFKAAGVEELVPAETETAS